MPPLSYLTKAKPKNQKSYEAKRYFLKAIESYSSLCIKKGNTIKWQWKCNSTCVHLCWLLQFSDDFFLPCIRFESSHLLCTLLKWACLTFCDKRWTPPEQTPKQQWRQSKSTSRDWYRGFPDNKLAYSWSLLIH